MDDEPKYKDIEVPQWQLPSWQKPEQSRGFGSLSPHEQSNLMGLLPPEVRMSIVEQGALLTSELDRIMNAPFAEEELRWLTRIRREIAVVYAGPRMAQVDYWTMLQREYQKMPSMAIKAVEATSLSPMMFVHDKGTFFYRSRTNLYDPIEKVSKSTLVKELAGRFGPDITNRIPHDYREGALHARPRSLYSNSINLVLLDLKSVFFVFKRRFEKVGVSSVQSARQRTMAFLDNAVAHMMSVSNLAVCEIWLTTSVVDMELDVDVGYPESRSLDSDDIKKLEQNIHRLHNILREAVAHLY